MGAPEISKTECRETPPSKILDIIKNSKSGLDSLKADAERTKGELDTKQKTAEQADKAMVEIIIANKEQQRGNLSADLIFEIQKIEPGAAIEIFTKTLNPADGEFTHEVIFTSANADGTTTKNQWAERKIGLAMLGPWQSTFRTKNTDGIEEEGERCGLTGSFLDGPNYIEILEGYKIPNPNLPYKSNKSKANFEKEYQDKKTAALTQANTFFESSQNKTVIDDGTETMSQILDKRCENSTEIIKRVYELGYLNDVDPHFLLSLLTSSEKGEEFKDFLDIAEGEEFGLEARLYLLIRRIHIVQKIYEAGGKKAFSDDLKISEEFALYFISNFLDHDKDETKEKSLKIFGIYNSISPTNKMPDNVTALNRSLDELQTAPKPGERSGYFETRGYENETKTLLLNKTRKEKDLQTLKDIPENTPINQLSFVELCTVARVIFGDGPGAQLLIDVDERFGATGKIIATEIALAKHEGGFYFGRVNGDPTVDIKMKKYQQDFAEYERKKASGDTKAKPPKKPRTTDVSRGTFQIWGENDKGSLHHYRKTFWDGVRYAEKIGKPIKLNNGSYELKAGISITPQPIPGNLSAADVDLISHLGYIYKERGGETRFQQIAYTDFAPHKDTYVKFISDGIQGGIPKIGLDMYNMMYENGLVINTQGIEFMD